MTVQALVNLNRYPIADHDSSARAALVTECRQALDANAICLLPEFIMPDGISLFARELNALAPNALTKSHLSTAYAWTDNSGFPPDHPRSALFERRFSYVLTEQISKQSAISKLFHWDVVTNFVRDALGFKTLHQSACPTLAIQLNYMNEGDVLPWHFDTNDGVVSLLIDQADVGGDFQVVPYVRSEDDENYSGVAQAFNEDPSIIKTPVMKPGTFVLFKGRRSVHRVTPIGKTKKPRTIVLYSYDEKPGMEFTSASRERMKKPDAATYLGAQTPANATGFRLWQPQTS